MDALTLKLLILFLPGFLCLFVIRSLASVKEDNNYQAAITALVLGLVSYLTYWPFHKWLCSSDYTVFDSILGADKENKLDLFIIAGCSIWSLILGVVASIFINRKIFHRVMHKLGVTNKFAERDVWSFVMNTEDKNLEWIFLRDFENDQLYFGHVKAFSSTAAECELLLSDVKVYENSSGIFMYDVPVIYLSRDVKKIAIEYPSTGEKNVTSQQQ